MRKSCEGTGLAARAVGQVRAIAFPRRFLAQRIRVRFGRVSRRGNDVESPARRRISSSIYISRKQIARKASSSERGAGQKITFLEREINGRIKMRCERDRERTAQRKTLSVAASAARAFFPIIINHPLPH